MNLAPALTALHFGRIIGLPTDTVYGIGVDPENHHAVDSLFAVKGRGDDKPIPILAASFADARGFGLIDDAVEQYWPGALTVVVHRTPAVPHWLGDHERNTIALRVPDNSVALALLAQSGPLAVTSANRSDEPPAVDDVAARAILGEAVAVYLVGSSPAGASSTVVDLTGPAPVVLRQGPVEWSDR
ncbi:MAG TPA: L-threonylcarbamoyladenylate synthase [Acidimicrobiia bacterium]|nr:L-threonylcarbamoyladenylate synthase [Acidimicrobiia bacterium]